MAGTRHTHRCRSSSASDVERRRSSRYTSVGSNSKKRGRKKGVDLLADGNHHGRESELRDSLSSRKRGRRGRSRLSQDVSHDRADEKTRTRSFSRAGFSGTHRTRKDGKVPSIDDGGREMQGREKKHLQHQASGRRRRRSSGRTHNDYERYNNQDTFSFRETGGSSNRYDSSSTRCDNSSKRYENRSNRRYEGSGCSNGKYDSSAKYGENSIRSARGDNSSYKRYRDYSSSRYMNTSSRYVGGGTGEREKNRNRYAGSDGGSLGEEGVMRGGHHSSKYVKSNTSKRGAPLSSSEFGDGAPVSKYSGSSTRYAKHSCSSSGLYGSAYSSRDGIESRHDGERWRRVTSYPHSAGRHGDGEGRTQKYGLPSRSAERDNGTGGRTAAAKGVTGPALEKGKRGRGVAAGYEDTVSGELRHGRTAGGAPGGEKRRCSVDIEEDGLHKKQRLQVAAATIGSRASFLRSNAPVGVPRVGGAFAHDAERGNEELGHDRSGAASRSTAHRESRVEDILDPPLRKATRDTERGNARVVTDKCKRGEEWNAHHRSQQQSHQQRKKEEQDKQVAEWEQHSSHVEQQHADAAEQEVLHKKKTYTCTSMPRSGATGAYAGTDTEDELLQQSKRGKEALEGAAVERREASAEGRTVDLRPSADKDVNVSQGEKEEQRQGKKETHTMKRASVAKEKEELGASDKVRSSRRGSDKDGEQQTKDSGRMNDAASVCSTKERVESEQVSAPLKLQMKADVSEANVARTGIPARRPDEPAATAAAAVAGIARAADAEIQEGGETIAEREDGTAREKKDEGLLEKGEVRTELAVAANEAAARTVKEYAGGTETERKAAAAAADPKKDEEIPEAGETETAAPEQFEVPAKKDLSFLPIHPHTRPRGGSRDGGYSEETAAGDAEVEGSEPSGDTCPLVCRSPSVAHQDAESSAFGGRRSPSADGTATAADSVQSQEKNSAFCAALRDSTAATAADSSSTPAKVCASGVDGLLMSTGGVVIAEGQVSEGSRSAAVRQHGRDRRQDTEVAENDRSQSPRGEADATVEGKEKTTTEAPMRVPTDAAGSRGERSRLCKGGRRFGAAAAAVEDGGERDHQQRTIMKACEKRQTTTSGSEMPPSYGSWRVVTLDNNNKNGVTAGGMRVANREYSNSNSNSRNGEGCRHVAERFSRKRGKDEEERRERTGAEERRRILYREPPPYHSPALQHNKSLAEYSQPPYIVPRPSPPSSRVPLRRNYSPSRPYSPSRDISPGPCAAALYVAYSKSNSYRTVQYPLTNYPTNISSSSRATALPRTVVVPPPQFPSHGSAVSSGVTRNRRGDIAFFLPQETSAGDSPGMRCGYYSATQSARVAPGPLPSPSVAHQQHLQQCGRRNNWNPYPASGIASSPLKRPEERLPYGDTALSKSGAARNLRRKDDFKWAHDLYEQVAHEPEKSRRRFNLYSENLEIAD